MKNYFKNGHQPDYMLLVLTAVLTAAGLVILSSASSDLGKIQFNDSYYYLKHQILYGLFLGIIGFLLGYKIYYRSYRFIALPFLILSVVLLALVFTNLGLKSGGASRWLKIGPLSFQPSEVLKLSFIIYLATWLSNSKVSRVKDLYTGFIPFLVISGLVSFLLILQPATSTVFILLGTGFLMYFLSGAKLRYLAMAVILGLSFLSLVVLVTPYRLQRINSFLNPQKDVQGSGYQADQALIAIGSGGLWGAGYGRSASKVNYLPAAVGDSIFAVAAQELGFVGAAALIILFAFLVFRLLWLALKQEDRFGKLILVGFASIIAFQSIINMGAISGIMPLTGIPLPFVSYGGTALAAFLTMMGISANVSKFT